MVSGANADLVVDHYVERAFLPDGCGGPQSDLAGSASRRAWSGIAPNLEEILDEFYGAILRSSERRKLAGVDLERLKTRQRQHWHGVFYGTHRKRSLAGLNRMHTRHADIGLSSVDYIRAYFFFLIKFHRIALREAGSLGEAVEFVCAVDALVGADIAKALTMYHETHMIE